MIKPTLLYPSECILAESPYWHAKHQSFYWVDIENGVLYRHHLSTQETKTWTFPHRLTLVVEGKQDQLILALDARIASFNPATEKLEWLQDVENNLPINRCNDGACDEKGRLWIGTMSTRQEEGAGALYCVDKDLTVTRRIEKTTISNGIAWSLDNKTLYHIDSPTHKIKAYKFEAASGNIQFERIAVRIPEEMGTPDGMCMDQKGNLWVAHYGGFGVYCWNPESGDLVAEIKLPVPNVTSCAFGGEGGDLLLITTARENLSDEELNKYPESGSVFTAKMKVQGAPIYTCAF